MCVFFCFSFFLMLKNKYFLVFCWCVRFCWPFISDHTFYVPCVYFHFQHFDSFCGDHRRCRCYSCSRALFLSLTLSYYFFFCGSGIFRYIISVVKFCSVSFLFRFFFYFFQDFWRLWNWFKYNLDFPSNIIQYHVRTHSNGNENSIELNKRHSDRALPWLIFFFFAKP